MKKLKSIWVLSLALFTTFIFTSCTDTTVEDFVVKQELLEKKKPEKVIYYKGLKVRHRYKASEDELKIKHNKKSLKTLYNKLREKYKKAKKSKTNSLTIINPDLEDTSLLEEELPANEIIFEAAKTVISQFPYEEIESYSALNRVGKEHIYYEMIKTDFPDLTDAEIQANESVIDSYYSDNLDYMVLDEIAQNPSVYENVATLQSKNSSSIDSFVQELAIANCTITNAFFNGFGLVRPIIAYTAAIIEANNSSENHYKSYNLAYSNTRKDAYRHMLWNALLAQYYFTISSKSKRVAFAKCVTDYRESGSCNTLNSIDSREMDYHNNAIGRKIWSDNTGYLEVFGFTFGLSLPFVSSLKYEIFEKVEKYSCYIVKKHPDNSVYDYTVEETRNLILQTASNTPVYFEKYIAPRWYQTTTTYDYSDCSNGKPILPKVNNSSNKLNIQSKDKTSKFSVFLNGKKMNKKKVNKQDFVQFIPNDEDCAKEVTTTTLMSPCFISKDPNLNPYQQ
ncbi:MAG: hypothetical protein HWD85_09035 [Flavobacteriaceae bacterium]|nr:hypothetical protein [Flavobacteriaceae bacterium]